MIDRLRQVLGAVRLTIQAAEPGAVLSRLARDRIYFWNLCRPDRWTVALTVRLRDWDRAAASAVRAQGEITEAEVMGLPTVTGRLRRRWVFFLAAGAILLSMQPLTEMVWYVDVVGNDRVPAEAIRRELEELGVGFGTWGLDIHPQDLKNRVLAEIPELSWLTVVRSGCLATAVVRERPEEPTVTDRRIVTNLVASRDSLITEVEALSGQAAVVPGAVVQRGEVLITGLVDLERTTMATRALGEVYGRTWYRVSAVTPAEAVYQTWEGETHSRYALIVGRKRINLYEDSGNWGAGCDKMVTYHPLMLPGGVELPVTLVEEQATERVTEVRTIPEEEARSLLESGREAAVTEGMVAGEVLRRTAEVCRTGGAYRLTGTWECREMVAREVPAYQRESEGTPWQNESSMPSGSSS